MQATQFNQLCEARNVHRQHDWVMQQFFVALVAEDSGLTFDSPRALTEDAVGSRAWTVA